MVCDKTLLARSFRKDSTCEEKLAIEIDGKIHEKQKEYDKARQEIIERYNINFIRIENEEPSPPPPLPSKFPGEGWGEGNKKNIKKKDKILPPAPLSLPIIRERGRG